jgi:hypothetical protein
VAGGSLSGRVLRCGFVLALIGAAVQAALHLLDVYGFDGRVAAINSDNAGEGNVFTWASSSATFAAALFCVLLLLAERRTVLGLVAVTLALFSLDDALVLHERGAPAFLELVGLDDRFSRLAWPALLLPLMAFVALTVWRRSATASRDEQRVLRGAIVLLGLAVVLELALFPVPDGGRAHELLEPLFVAAEESIELGAWILLAAGLASVLVRRIAIDSAREAADRRGRDDHPDGPALVAGERRLRGLRRG